MSNKVVFITGGNRGIGLELCKIFSLELGYKVYMGARNIDKAHEVITNLDLSESITPIEIDVSSEESISKAVSKCEDNIDIFINNAGVSLDWIPNISSIKTLDIDMKTLIEIYKVNTFAPIFTTKYFLDKLKCNSRIVNVSSGAGELWDKNANEDFQIGYASSKSALFMISKKISGALINKKIYVNSVCPDWCKTDMGGSEATYTARQGAESIVKACFLDTDNPPTGQYFRNGQRIPIDIYPN